MVCNLSKQWSKSMVGLLFVISLVVCGCHNPSKKEAAIPPKLSFEPKEYEDGTFFVTLVNDDNVNIRKNPGLQYEVIGKVNKGDIVAISGMSSSVENADGMQSYWFRVFSFSKEQDKVNRECLGWIFGKYLNGVSSFKPQNVRVMDYLNSSESITITISSQTITLDKYKSNNYYVFFLEKNIFTYDEKINCFNYVPGTYIFIPKEEESSVSHLCYYYPIDDGAVIWLKFIDGTRYLVHDVGTGTVREVVVYDTETEKTILSGKYDHDVGDIQNYELNIVYFNSYEEVPESDLKYGEEFVKTAPELQDNGLFIELCYLYKINFITKERKFIKCYYKYTE